MAKSNPFKDWTIEDVDRHNERALGHPQGSPPPSVPPVPKGPVKLKRRMKVDELGCNQTERLFLEEFLRPAYDGVGIERITLKLAEGCRYTPDFDTIDDEGRITFWDTKGGKIWDDAIVKIKVAARLYPWARFIVAQKKNKKSPWTFTEYPP